MAQDEVFGVAHSMLHVYGKESVQININLSHEELRRIFNIASFFGHRPSFFINKEQFKRIAWVSCFYGLFGDGVCHVSYLHAFCVHFI